MRAWDVAIVGGGILGTCAAYWLSDRYEGRIAVLEQESEVAMHASGRNTGVLHRPFYLEPTKSRTFARSSLLSFDLWKSLADKRDLPWEETGTLKVAVRREDLARLDQYQQWAGKNGLEETELEFLDARQVRALEPNVVCKGALHAKKETGVDFGAFTRGLKQGSEENGVRYLTERRVTGLSSSREGVEIDVAGSQHPHRAHFVINCAGGDAVDLAHSLGVGGEYTDLHFRGEYWKVGERASALASRNVYTVPKYPEFPFLDPHWIVKASGEREIGPNAVPVASPWTYEGFFENVGELFRKATEPPVDNKARLVLSPTFLRLAVKEGVGSFSRSFVAGRVRQFLPELREEDLTSRGTAGVRSSLVDRRGRFLREVMELAGPASAHILNYNSPGATGAPAYTADLLSRLGSQGCLDHLHARPHPAAGIWDYEEVVAGF